VSLNEWLRVNNGFKRMCTGAVVTQYGGLRQKKRETPVVISRPRFEPSSSLLQDK
jgi:hypothetical protein